MNLHLLNCLHLCPLKLGNNISTPIKTGKKVYLCPSKLENIVNPWTKDSSFHQNNDVRASPIR